MQRQSLGSPLSKLHSHGGLTSAVVSPSSPSPKSADAIITEDTSTTTKRRDSFSVSSSLTITTTSYNDDEEHKSMKPYRLSSSSSSSLSSSSSSLSHSQLVHLIPVLTLFCFLVLFLFSHTPSQADLAQFNGFKSISSKLDSSNSEIGDIDRLAGVRKSDVLAIRSIRNLQEIDHYHRKHKISRKFADI